MLINSVASYNFAPRRANYKNQPSFGKTYVTLSEKNNADYVEKKVVDNFKSVYYPALKKDAEFNKFQAQFASMFNAFLLAAGSGSRFAKLAKTQNPNANKISYEYFLNNGKKFHMPDTNFARAAHFMEDDEIEVIKVKEANGSLGQVIETYMAGEPIKDTVIYCGDNQLHTDDVYEIDKFFVEAMKSGNKMALISARKTPQEVANSLGCMVLDGRGLDDDKYRLFDFTEKPSLKEAQRLADDTNSCYANAGMFVFSKEAIKYLLDEIKKNPNFIAKDAKEKYDFALAQEKVLKHFGPNQCIVKVVDGEDWIDTGKPSDFQHFLEEARDEGKFLNVFAPEDAEAIQETFKEKVGNGYFINQEDYDNLKVEDVEKQMNVHGLDEGCTLIN